MSFLFVPNVFAQDQDKQITPDKTVVQEQPRVIEETLVLNDPTVAHPGNGLSASATEYWYVSPKTGIGIMQWI